MTRTVNLTHHLFASPVYQVTDDRGVIVDAGWIAMSNGLFAAHSNVPPHTPFAFGADVDRVIERMRVGDPIDAYIAKEGTTA